MPKVITSEQARAFNHKLARVLVHPDDTSYTLRSELESRHV